MKQPNQIKGYKVDKSTIINLEKGKIPPQAIDLEEVVLGAMMIDKKGVDEVIDILSIFNTKSIIFCAYRVSCTYYLTEIYPA